MNNVYSLYGPDNPEIDSELELLNSGNLAERAKAGEAITGRLRASQHVAVEWLLRTGFYEAHPLHPGLIQIAEESTALDASMANRIRSKPGRPKENHSIRDRLIKVLMDKELIGGTSKLNASDLVSVIIQSLPELETMSAGSVRNIHRRVTSEDDAAIEDIKK
mgnify:CR=1 FL=1